MERTLDFQEDANFNVTSLILDTTSSTDSIVERYTMTPYSVRTVRNASWTVIGSSAYSNFYGHQGGKIDAATSLVYFRFRDYNAALGRWITEDPAGWPDGLNRFGAYYSHPSKVTDPLGLQSTQPKTPRTPKQKIEDQLLAFLVKRLILGPGLTDAVQFGLDFEERARKASEEIAQEYPPELYGDVLNAARHAYWMLNIARAFGKALAKAVGEIHEAGTAGTNEEADSKADTANNDAALQNLDFTGLSRNEMKRRLKRAIDEGMFFAPNEADPSHPTQIKP